MSLLTFLARLLGWRRLSKGSENEVESPVRFRVVRVAGDGRCLFRSIARCFASLRGYFLTRADETARADELRKVMNQKFKERRTELVSKCAVEGDFDIHVAKMQDTRSFAGQVEIIVLAEAIGIVIEIYMVENKALRRIDLIGLSDGERLEETAKDRLRILYNGINHYDALVVDVTESSRPTKARRL